MGFVLMVVSHRPEGIRFALVRRFLALTVLLMLIGLGMSLYLTPLVGSLHGETPLTTGVVTLCWLACHAAAILYICHCYSKIPLRILDKTFGLMLALVLMVCLVQVGAVSGVPGFRELYDATNLGEWFHLADYRYERLSGVATEPSGMASVISMFCFPYAASKLQSTRKIRYCVAIILLLIIAYFTYSSTVYISLVCSLAAFVVVYLVSKKGRISQWAIAGSMVAIAGALLLGLFTLSPERLEDNTVISTINSLFDKINDNTNPSTAYRNSTVTNDLKLFSNYPLFGVGEGNQGFFYADNLDVSVLNSGSTEVRDALRGKNGVLNGGSFVPSLISGFGIVGGVAYIGWLISGIRWASRHTEAMGSYYQMYLMSFIGSLPMLWIGIGFSGLPISFFLIAGMPFLADRVETSPEMV